MQPQGNNSTLTILHTNDFHNRLSEAKAEHIEEICLRTSGPKMLLDAGDAVGSGNITFRPAGEPILARMSQLGYDAMTVGNRDFHVNRVGFRCKLSLASFPALCANIRPSKVEVGGIAADADRPLERSTATAHGETEPDVYAFRVFNPSPDWTVAVLGLTVPMVTERMWERKLSAYIFDDPIRTAAQLVPELRRRFVPDLVIALTHIGTRRDRELAEAVPGIDLIIGGHSHDVMPEGELVAGKLLVQTGSHAHNIGIVTVTRRPDSALGMTACLEAL